MSTESNIASRQAFRAAVNEGRLEAFADLVTPASVDHDGGPGQGPGPDGYQAFFTELRAAFPDLHIEAEHVTAAEDDVAFAYTLTGTHSGSFQGHQPTGRSFSVRGVQISRFEGGLLAERWGSTDEAGLLKQLGLA